MKLSSPAFSYGGDLPMRFARAEGNVSPPLAFSEVPAQAQSLVVVMDDPDAPHGTFTHWLVWNVPARSAVLNENALPPTTRLGRNDFGFVGYGGPRPPSGTHRYFFHAYALDCPLDLPVGAARRDLERALEPHVIENAELMGRFTAVAASAR